MIELIFLCLMTSSLSLFIDKCFETGMIFDYYYRFISNIAEYYPWTEYFLKPFGLCIYCFSAWVFIASYLYENGFAIEIFGGLGLNYLFIRAYEKFITND